MPLDTSIPLQAKAPEMTNPLEMMLKVGQYKYLQQNTNKLQKDMDANEAVSQAIQASTGPDGKVDYGNVNSLLKGDPRGAYNGQAMQGANLSQQGQQISNGTAQIGQQGAALKLNDEVVSHLTQGMGELLNKPNPTYADVVQKLVTAGATYKLPHDVVAQSIANFPNTTDPAQIKSEIQARLARFQAPGAQLSTMSPTPTQVDNGAIKQYVDTNPVSNPGIVGKTIQNKLPPGQQNAIRADQLGNPYIEQRSPTGDITGTARVPGSYNASNGQIPGAGPVMLPPGGAGDIEAVKGEVATARAAGNNAPVMRDLNRSIIAEVDKGMNTGTLGKLTQRVASATGYNLGSESATDYNVLGKLLERSAIQAAQGMGPQTNAGLEAQIRANGSLEYTPQAIRKIAVMNDALNTGVDNYRKGLEASITAAGGNQLAKRQFDQAWSQNFDPRIMRLQNAHESGDKAEMAAVIKEVGGPGSKGAAELAAKAQKLNLLISQGRL